MVAKNFEESHRHSDTGRFMPRKPQAKGIGESRTEVVRRFLTVERSLRSRNQFISDVVEGYFEMRHTEHVPPTDLQNPGPSFLPPHACCAQGA